MTRTTNDVQISNAERARIANKSGATLCVKLHCDGVRPLFTRLGISKRGTMTLIPSASCISPPLAVASAAAAATLHPQVVEATGFMDRGIRVRDDLTGFCWSTIPVVLCELGFLTDAEEERNLIEPTFQRRVAAGLAAGIESAIEVLVTPLRGSAPENRKLGI